MSMEVRCGRCGGLLIVADGSGKKVRCGCCGSKIRVPGVLRAPPQPRLTGQESVLAAAGGAQFTADAQEYRQEVITRAVPWILSVMLHASVALILAFIVMLTVAEDPTKHDIAIGVFASPVPRFPAPEKTDDKLPRLAKRETEREAERGRGAAKGGKLSRDAADKIKIVNVWGPGNTRPEGGLLGPPDSSGDGTMFGGGGSRRPPGIKAAKYIVFVIDRSGSMVDTFGRVRVDILDTVGRMRKDQNFHVILFSDGPPIENRPRRLVSAVEKRKLDLVGFLKPIRASGRTDPLPALTRAFNILAGTKGKDNKLIHLLTDGVFPDNDKVLALIRRRTAGTGIRINTYLCGHRPPAADMVMKKIALESKGVYKYVSLAE